ncbi:hypothetical protein KUTeg_006570 [Tegillarca granosa]|uniref:B3/B4 tRNA-binding domain-containing protein n=1 Tax=Tegillarca granosa TaxID=220873 RepID=A0ABQ9FEX9_TEGGR|nr:hypothetical protein KUTeg_006570 [Tegillarca granosa]
MALTSVTELRKMVLDSGIYNLTWINYLDVSKTCLSSLTSELGNLVSLTNLVLHNNQLAGVPKELSKLVKLKYLDLSNNKITNLEADISNLTDLQCLNVSMNMLSEFPSVESLVSLHILNLSHNSLESLPEGIYSETLVHLSQILASNNEISNLLPAISDLPHLNTLDLSSNKLTEVPAELCECPKLKELNLKSNKFKDRRFGKLVEQCPTKSVVDYLVNVLKKEREKSGSKKKTEKKKKAAKKEEKEIDEIIQDIIRIVHFDKTEGVSVQVTPGAASTRPYIVCCIVRDLDLKKSLNIFKHFITLQRQAATIATHDMKSIKMPLTYDAKLPQLLKIRPLFKHKESTGRSLVATLTKEAEEMRKEQKRNKLLQGKELYPCLVDGDGDVISFPPITNSDKTKISNETTDILIEVTSSTNLDVCKKALDELLQGMLRLGVGATDETVTDYPEVGASEPPSDSITDPSLVKQKKLLVEQVKVTDLDGNMRVIYPARPDLNCDDIKIIRDFE